MKWTTDKPTEPGWYWWQEYRNEPSNRTIAYVSPVNGTLQALFIDGESLAVDKCAGYFQGPITPQEDAP